MSLHFWFFYWLFSHSYVFWVWCERPPCSLLAATSSFVKLKVICFALLIPNKWEFHKEHVQTIECLLQCLAFMDASPQRQFIETTVYRTTVHRMTVDRNDSYTILSFVTDIHKTFQSHFCSLSHLKWIPFLSYFTIIHNCSLHCCSDLWFSCFWLPLITSRY